jgi:UDP-glucose:(heptosyl)LPS alpha-1,3-glucosyltransferase
MRIGLARRGFSASGGAESYLKRLGRALVDHGHQTTLYTTGDWPAAEWPYGKLVTLPGHSPRRFAEALAIAKGHDDVLFSLERVLSCDFYRAGDGVHLSWLRRRSRYENPWRARFRALQPKHRELLYLESKLFKEQGARCTIANSEMVKNEIISAFGVPENRIKVVYNGIPDLHFQRKTAVRRNLRRSFGLTESDVALLFVGSGWQRKGLRFAISALERIRDRRLKMFVAGRGRPPWRCDTRVRFLGVKNDPQPLFQAADLFILPTIYDPFSNACLEAAAAGLPVITTRANGFAEIMQSGLHGEVIALPEDITAVSQAINVWMAPEKRSSAGSAVRELASRFSMENNLRATLSILETL